MQTEYNFDLCELLNFIDPRNCSYQEWVNVGMALKYEGYSCSVWDNWSQGDADRYHSGECERKWRSFNGTGTPVTGATITTMAKEGGWTNVRGIDAALDWDSEINYEEHIVVQKGWIEGKDVVEPGDDWNPVKDLTTYLTTLFDSTDNVGYVTRSYDKDGKKGIPGGKGNYDRTAGQLIQELSSLKDKDIGKVLGDYRPEVGAWIRFNPLDGKGVANVNVTDFRYALVECDDMDLAEQNAIIRALELPAACLVFSGKKSLHAIVKIDAADYQEYRKRVEFLYDICKKNGLNIDTQNKNPSRLSRMPGVMRNGHKQFLLDTNLGKDSWNTWEEWINAVNDNLPEPEALSATWNNLPDLAPSLIDGVLRQGHKMLLAGPSKAGKSFALIELCCAIAEGRSWIGFDCAQGRVLYVNLELDRASCLHRFKDVYEALNWSPDSLENIDVWNLRGKSIPMDKLAPKLIRRANKKNYIAIIIDPIYKIITGDENSADQMAHFCNQFDKICTELGCSVIYCHHHSKGTQGNKASMDRASGSGVFARDPDALLDLIQLDVRNKKDTKVPLEGAGADKGTSTAWRIDGTLREFPKFEPVNLWFKYPVHYLDDSGMLEFAETADAKTFSSKGTEKRQSKKQEKIHQVNIAFESLKKDGKVSVKDMAEFLDVSEKTTRQYIKESNLFEIANNYIFVAPKDKSVT